MRNCIYTTLLCAALLASCTCVREREHNSISAPCYPLVTIDPYTSIWSFGDVLSEKPTCHWTGKDYPLVGVVVVDGCEYRFLGQALPKLRKLVGTSEQDDWTGRYVTSAPSGEWQSVSFDDSAWKQGKAAFGTRHSEETAKTQWGSEFIWVRRHVSIPEDLSGKNVYLTFSHDDDAQIFVNGIKVVDTGNAARKNITARLSDEAVASLKVGEDNVISAYCWNRHGNAILDFGLAVEENTEANFEETAIQTSVEVLPTQTYYTFECGGVELEVRFTAPFLPGNLELVSRPVNYLSYVVKSRDGKNHDIKVYLEASPLLAQNTAFQTSRAFVSRGSSLNLVKTGTVEQNILGRKGDDVRIDWGYFCMASRMPGADYGVGDAAVLHKALRDGSSLPKEECTDGSLALIDSHKGTKKAEGCFLIGYDDIYSVQYFSENLRPYWNRTGEETIEHQFELADGQYASIMKECLSFDNGMMKEATEVGGEQYAALCALAYRQSYAAHKLCESADGELHWLSKENFSNGSIGTVDVTYPSAPLYLLYNVDLAKGLLNHIFHYSETGRWTKPFAAHDIGTYPIANGQTYGGDMPVEESGNMLILTAAIAKVEGNAEYALKHWDVLTTWVDYLVQFGLDPGNQLCTDDFAGHFAHNANLSIKAIEAIGSYALLAENLGKSEVAEKYRGIAVDMASKWADMAREGDHYKLTFDGEGTWSLKYNLVWDTLLGLNLFPEEITETELQFYKGKQNKYGVPLDCRKDYTKSDWIVWTATMASDKDSFESFIAPIYRFMDETEDRVPLSDWTFTSRAVHQGFQARSVVGGYFMKMLSERWKD